jgi:branched-chain amino acid transport system ATP-binding protein
MTCFPSSSSGGCSGRGRFPAASSRCSRSHRLLLIDEPTKGLAPLLVKEVARVLERASETETILLVEQNLGVVQAVARDAVVLDQGRVAYTGAARELLSDPELVKRLLGVSRAQEAARP